MASSNESLTTEAVCRRAMKVAMSLMCNDAGFAVAEDAALETLIEMTISCECTALIYYLSIRKLAVVKKSLVKQSCSDTRVLRGRGVCIATYVGAYLLLARFMMMILSIIVMNINFH
jgi:hypothetical protein